MADSSDRARRKYFWLLPDWRTILSAVLIVASFPPWDFRFLIFIALIPWFSALRRCPNWKRAAVQGVWLSVLMSLFGFYWVAYVLKQFGNLPWALAGGGLLAYSFFGQPQFILFAPIYFRFRGSMGRPLDAALRSFFLAALYTGIDWILPKLFRDTLGHSMYSAPWIRQAADIGGASLLTLVIFWVNDALFGLFRELRYRREPSFWPAIAHSLPTLTGAFALLSLIAGYGAWRSQEIRDALSRSANFVHAGVVQANIGDFDKVAAEQGVRGAADSVLTTYFGLSEKALLLDPHPDFLVWPETAYPSTFRTPMTSDDLSRDQRVESFVRLRGTPLLFGGYDRADGKDFNAFFLLSPRPDASRTITQSVLDPGGDLQTYRKNILLLFGEYVPFTENSSLFAKYFPQVANFGRGPGPEVLKIPRLGSDKSPILAGPIICYEALFADYVIGAARRGSQLILNVTNDSWFGPYGEAELHLALSVFRSIETRLPQLRSTNTGYSALILPDGEISQKTRTFQQEILNVAIPIWKAPETWMVRFGDWFGRFSLGVGAFGLAGIYFERRRRLTA